MRHQDWQKRLNECILKNAKKPFKRGQHDCAMFAVKCANTMRKDVKDFAQDFKKDYKNKKEADKILKDKGFKTLEDVATKKLGEPLPSASFAGRGDCVSVKCPEGIALAIVDLTGRRAVTTGKNGLEYYPMDQWLKAWRI